MQIALDTNVILDYLDDREPFAGSAEAIIELCGSGELMGYFTANTATDIYYIMKKIVGDKEARRLICAMVAILGIIDITGGDVIQALKSPMADFEDAMLSESSKRHNLDYIITRNIKDFKESSVPAIEPEDFIAQLPK